MNIADAIYNVEAEKRLLGAILVYNNFSKVQRIIGVNDFSARNQDVFKAMATAFAISGTVTFVEVENILKRDANYQLQDSAYLASLSYNVETERYTELFAHLVKRVSLRRQLLQLANDIPQSIADTDKSVNDIITPLIDKLKRLKAPDIDDNIVSIGESLAETHRQVENHVDIYEVNKQFTIGVRTGLHDLDYKLDGLRKGDIAVLAGYTGAGKTACVLTITLNAASKGINLESERPAKVLLFSGEMTEFAMNNRLVSMLSKVPTRTIERGAFKDNQYSDYMNAVNELQGLPIRLKRAQRITVEDLEVLIEDEISKNGCDLLILDGILQLDVADSDEKDWLRINKIMESLESMAITHKIAILATHQINRDGAKGKPSLADLKRSSSVEEKAARVLLLWKPLQSESEHHRQLVIAKNRHGETGVTDLMFRADTTRFYDMAYVKDTVATNSTF